MKEELRYRSSELEIIYLIWTYKRLHILLYSNNYWIVILTDYEVIRSIVYYNILNTTSIDRANWRFINASVYLSIYPLEIYYIFGRFNYISDVLLYFYIINDNIVRKSIIESVLDTFWNEDCQRADRIRGEGSSQSSTNIEGSTKVGPKWYIR